MAKPGKKPDEILGREKVWDMKISGTASGKVRDEKGFPGEKSRWIINFYALIMKNHWPAGAS